MDNKEKELEHNCLHEFNILMEFIDQNKNENLIQRQLGIVYWEWKKLTDYQEQN